MVDNAKELLIKELLLRKYEKEDKGKSPKQELTLQSVDRQQPIPLSWSQLRLWFLAQLDVQASLAYHLPFNLRLSGNLDIGVLKKP